MSIHEDGVPAPRTLEELVQLGAPILFTEEELAVILRHPTANHVKRHGSRWPHMMSARRRVFTPEHVREIVQLHTPTTDRVPGTGVVAPAASGRATRGGRL